MQIGKSTTLDKLGRITLLKEIRDLFMMEEGDTLTYYTEDGRIYIKKNTERYCGYDFENELIAERVRTYEKTARMMNGSEFDDWEFEWGNRYKSKDIEIEPEDEGRMMELKRTFMDDIAEREQRRKKLKME